MDHPKFSEIQYFRLGDLVSDPYVQRTKLNQRNPALKAAREGRFNGDAFGVLHIRVSPDGSTLWRIDGDHRCEGAALAGWSPDTWVPCINHGKISDAEAARIFLGLDDRTAIKQVDRHLQEIVAGTEENLAVQKIMQNHNLVLDRGGRSSGRQENAFAAIGTLLKMYRCFGEKCVDDALTVGSAVWGRPGTERDVLESLCFVLAEHSDIDLKALIFKLKTACPKGIVSLRQATHLERSMTGRTQINACCAVLVAMYNKNKQQSSRLPIWPATQPQPKQIKARNPQ